MYDRSIPIPTLIITLLRNVKLLIKMTLLRNRIITLLRNVKCGERKWKNAFRQTKQKAGTVYQQWATKVVETLLENDTFRYWSTCFILFASSVNSLIPPAPNSMLCYRCWGLCCIRNRKISIVLRERVGWGDTCKMQKIEFYCKCLNTFVTHCNFFKCLWEASQIDFRNWFSESSGEK